MDMIFCYGLLRLVAHNSDIKSAHNMCALPKVWPLNIRKPVADHPTEYRARLSGRLGTCWLAPVHVLALAAGVPLAAIHPSSGATLLASIAVQPLIVHIQGPRRRTGGPAALP